MRGACARLLLSNLGARHAALKDLTHATCAHATSHHRSRRSTHARNVSPSNHSAHPVEMVVTLPPKENTTFKQIVVQSFNRLTYEPYVMLLDAPGGRRRPWSVQKFYETKQYKKGLKAAETILKKFPEHGGPIPFPSVRMIPAIFPVCLSVSTATQPYSCSHTSSSSPLGAARCTGALLTRSLDCMQKRWR